MKISKIKKLKGNEGFSIIEILIGIFIFSLGLLSIFMLITSTIKLNDYSKNSIIGSNLAREGIELVRNIRDSNYKSLHKWNQIKPIISDYSNRDNYFQTGTYYTIENNYETISAFGVDFIKKTNSLDENSKLLSNYLDFRLFIDKDDNYTHIETTTSKKTNFIRYIKIEEVKYDESGVIVINDALKVISKVIWFNRGYHEVEIKTIITDFKRL